MTEESASQSKEYQAYENTVRKILPYFFIFVFITTVVGAFWGYLEHNSWRVGDWLTNYQAGMIRRGLFGELVYRLSLYTNVTPGLFVFIFQSLFYALFLLFSYKLLRRQEVLLPYVLLILSPFLFTFQIIESQGGYRKEIIYFALLAYITWSAYRYDTKTFERHFYFSLSIYPLLIFSHEMFAVFLPYIVAVYIYVMGLDKRRFFMLMLFVIPSIVSFMVSLYFAGTSAQVAEILASLEQIGYPIDGGAIAWLDKSASQTFLLVQEWVLNKHTYLFTFLTLAIIWIAFIPISKRFTILFSNKWVLSLVVISLLGTLPLFFVATDWGRFIYIHLVSLFFLTFLSDVSVSDSKDIITRNFLTPGAQHEKKSIAFVLAYALLWQLPHFTPKPPIRKINVQPFVKPYVDVIGHYLR